MKVSVNGARSKRGKAKIGSKETKSVDNNFKKNFQQIGFHDNTSFKIEIALRILFPP